MMETTAYFSLFCVKGGYILNTGGAPQGLGGRFISSNYTIPTFCKGMGVPSKWGITEKQH